MIQFLKKFGKWFLPVLSLLGFLAPELHCSRFFLVALAALVIFLGIVIYDCFKRGKTPHFNEVYTKLTSDKTQIKTIDENGNIIACNEECFSNNWRKNEVFIAFTLRKASLNIIHFAILKKLKQLQLYSIKPIIYITVINSDTKKQEEEKIEEKNKIKETFIKVIEYYLGKKGCKWELKEKLELKSDIIAKLNGTTIQQIKKVFGLDHKLFIDTICQSLIDNPSPENIQKQCDVLRKIGKEEEETYFASLLVPLVESKIQGKYQAFVICGEGTQGFWKFSKDKLGNESPKLLFVMPNFTKIDANKLTTNDTEKVLSVKIDTEANAQIYPLKDLNNDTDCKNIAILKQYYRFFVTNSENDSIDTLNDDALIAEYIKSTKEEYDKINNYIKKF
ncbi:hypothetical protein AGMMS49525_02220 [Bacteroidia bacterium]|nr:hypothetical protein AGMMS49525_02220 [Bacteroidia bacterium]